MENRHKPAPASGALYKLKTSEIKKFINHERRYYERRRMEEVVAQKTLWWKTIIVCGALNLLLLALAVMGWQR